MDAEFLEMIVVGAPNFFGLIIAIILLYRRMARQDKLIMTLVQKWADCEDDVERRENTVSLVKVSEN